MCCIFAGDSMLIMHSHGVSTAVKRDAADDSACAVAVVCSEGCKVRGYPAESRTLPGGCCVSGDILRPDNSVAYA